MRSAESRDDEELLSSSSKRCCVGLPPAVGVGLFSAVGGLLFGLEFTIACVRTGDYFRVKLTPQNDAKSGKSPALRAVSEGKLKQKFESVGISLYALCLPDPTSTAAFPYVVTGTICLWFAVFFSYQSLLHKLRAREKAV